MYIIDAKGLDHAEINSALRQRDKEYKIKDCLGQRFIGAGMDERNIIIDGTPGNAVGAYLDGATITVNGNAQDAVGDTMNDGKIAIHGSCGDAPGYAMRGGEIYIQGDVGYRAGIHMKQYKEHFPCIVIGGRTGSFLGEYQAGGIIIVLGLNEDKEKIVGNFTGTGMHGGKIFLRGNCKNIEFPPQVKTQPACQEDMKLIEKYVREYCNLFGEDADKLLKDEFTAISPNSSNPYTQMYVAN